MEAETESITPFPAACPLASFEIWLPKNTIASGQREKLEGEKETEEEEEESLRMERERETGWGCM